MNKRIVICCVMLAAITLRPVMAQDEETERSGLRRLFFVTDEGIGGSVLTNAGSFFLNGDYDVFNAGAGFGISYKAQARGKHPFEVGLYLSPQVSGNGDETSASVSSLVHFSVYQAIGLGMGYRFWQRNDGIVGLDESSLFFTVGYTITNEK